MIGENDRFLTLQKQLREEILLGNKTWDDMITLYKEFGMPEMTKDSMRRSFKAYDQYADKGWISQPKNFDIPNKEVIEYNAEKNITISDKVISIDGNEIELNSENILVTMQGLDGYAFAGEGEIGVVLDTHITQELKEEGYVREVLSKVQNMRKDKGFEVLDKINLYVSGNEMLENVIKQNAELIKHDTLALDIIYDAERADYTETNINGENLKLDVEVVK